jgi:predicted alpha/beta superfamily hydrolase
MKRLGTAIGLILLAGALFASDGSFVSYKGKNFFQSKYLKFTPPVIVYLPKDYAASGKKYPVLYAHDGQNLFDAKTSFAGEWQMDENLDILVKEGHIDGVIIVGIWNTANRIGDYTPTLINNEYVKNQGGNLTNYAKFIIEELKPFIDSNYRTLPDRKNTGLIGSSLGGLASFYLLGMYPEVFGKAAAISASFWWDDERVIADMDKMKFPKDVKIYLDGGFKEGADESSMIKYMRDVYQKLKTKFKLKDLDNIFYYEDLVGTHSEKDWAKRGKMPLLYLYGKIVKTPGMLLLRTEPEIYKEGDVLKISADIQVNPHLLFTLYNTDLKSGNPKIIEISKDGKGLCKSAGKTDLSLKFGGQTYKQTLNVLPKIDGMVYTLVRVKSEEPVGEIMAVVVKMNDGPTNIVHTYAAASNLHFNFLISYPVNSKLVLNFQTKDGKAAVQTSGSPYIKMVYCKEDQVVDVLLKSWEK